MRSLRTSIRPGRGSFRINSGIPLFDTGQESCDEMISPFVEVS